MVKLIITTFLVILACRVSTAHASFTLSGATQTKITNMVSPFPTEYKNSLILETVSKNGLNPLTNTGISVYAQYFGNSTLGNSDAGLVAMDEIVSKIYVDIDAGLLAVRGIAGEAYALIDIPSVGVIPFSIAKVIENIKLQGNIVFKKAVDTVLLSNTSNIDSDGTTNTGAYLQGFKLVAGKETVSPVQNETTLNMNYFFKLRDRLGKRFFNVSQ